MKTILLPSNNTSFVLALMVMGSTVIDYGSVYISKLSLFV
jgi:hypothetical protein